MNWLTEKFGKQAQELVEKIHDKVVVDDEEHMRRLSICESCENFSKLHLCSECHCYMPLKTKFVIFNCPIKKW